MTPYGMTLLLAVVIAIVVAVVMVSLRKHAHEGARRLGDGPAPIMLQGRGTHSSKTLDFPAGNYRIDYRFSDEWATSAVFLISATTGDKEMLAYKTGVGSASFTVESAERGVIEVEPTADHVEWWLEIRPMRPLPMTPGIESRLP